MGLPEHCRYKYLLNWPGHTYSARLKSLLLCGSVVIFPDNGWYEFYYPLLRHGENIIMMAPLTQPSDVTHNLTEVVQVSPHVQLVAYGFQSCRLSGLTCRLQTLHQGREC